MSADLELAAIAECVKALDGVDGNARRRVIDYLSDRYKRDETLLEALTAMATELDETRREFTKAKRDVSRLTREAK